MPAGVYPRPARGSWTSRSPTKKMSTTGGTQQGTVLMLDPRTRSGKKFKTRRHGLGTRDRHDREKPGVSNLIEIMTVATGESIAEVEARYDGEGYGTFKSDVAEAVVELLRADPGAIPRAPRRPGRAPSASSRSAPSKARGRQRRPSRRCTSAWASSVRLRGRSSRRSAATSSRVSSRHWPGASPSRSRPA